MKARHCNGAEAVESEIPEEYRAQAEEAHDRLCELVAEADDELMMKYLEGEETLTQEELEGLLSKAIAERIFVPVFAGDCIKEQGVNSLMDDIATYFPARRTTARCRSSTAIRLRSRVTMTARWRLCLRPWPIRNRVASALSRC